MKRRSEMNTPGFTADASLAMTKSGYALTPRYAAENGKVRPQIWVQTCIYVPELRQRICHGHFVFNPEGSPPGGL
jgi:hypothetical protein